MLVRRQSLVFNSQASSATIPPPAITDANLDPSNSIQSAQPISTPFISTVTPSTSLPPASTQSPQQSQQPGAAVSSNSTSQPINLGTVVGACIGSLAFLILIVLIVIWHSRRTRNSIRLNDRRTKRDDWNKLPDNARDSRQSSFESKPSLLPISLEDTSHYPSIQMGEISKQAKSDRQQYTLPAHPYSSPQLLQHSVTTSRPNKPSGKNPFADPSQKADDTENDTSSFYSATSNPFESIYTPPAATSTNRLDSPESYSGSPFFTPHPDSSVQIEKWGSVGKERNVQESFASSEDKMGSLIAALSLDASTSHANNNEEKANRSMHGHLGKFDF